MYTARYCQLSLQNSTLQFSFLEAWECLFPHSLFNRMCCHIFKFYLCDEWQMVLRCYLNLYDSKYETLSIFLLCLRAIFISRFVNYVFMLFSHLFSQLVVFCPSIFKSSLYISNITPLTMVYNVNNFYFSQLDSYPLSRKTHFV